MVDELEALRAQVQALEAEKETLNQQFHTELNRRVGEGQALAERLARATVSASVKKRKVDIARPDSFDGTESKLDAFIHQLNLVFWAEPDLYLEEDNRITLALSYMKSGRAQPWAKRFMEHNQMLNHYSVSWQEFEALLKESFGSADPSLNAVDKLRNLQQGTKTADEYIVAFEEYEMHTGWDDKALKDQFEKGLKAGLVATIYRLPDMPTTLAEWKSCARKFDRQWRMFEEKQKLSRSEKVPGKQDSGRKESAAEQVPKKIFENGRYDGTGFTFGGRGQPMDVDQVRQRRRCFVCDQSGHVARFCPQKKRADVRRIAAGFDKDQIQELKEFFAERDSKSEQNQEDFPQESQ